MTSFPSAAPLAVRLRKPPTLHIEKPPSTSNGTSYTKVCIRLKRETEVALSTNDFIRDLRRPLTVGIEFWA